MTFLKDANGTAGLTFSSLAAGTLSGLRVSVDSVEETATDKAIIALPSVSALLAEAVTFPRDTHTSGVNLTAVSTINVDSTANFAATGKIHIREITMTYTSKTATSFTLDQSLAAYGCPDLNDDEEVGGVVTLTDGSALPLTRNGLRLPNGSVVNFWTRSGNELRGTQGGTGTHAIGAAVAYRTGSMRMDQLGRVFAGANYFGFTNPSDNDHKNELYDFMIENGRVYTRSLHLRENGDPVDLMIERGGGDYNLPYGPMSGLKSGENMGTIRWRAGTKSAVNGAYTGMRFTSAAIYARLAEDAILEAGGNNGNVGASFHFATVPIGGDSTADAFTIRHSGAIGHLTGGLTSTDVDTAMTNGVSAMFGGKTAARGDLVARVAATGAASATEARMGQVGSSSELGVMFANDVMLWRTASTELRINGSLVLEKYLDLLGAGTGTGYVQFSEQTATVTAPAANKGRVYMDDNGSGKTRLMVRFPTGAAVQIAIEP